VGRVAGRSAAWTPVCAVAPAEVDILDRPLTDAVSLLPLCDFSFVCLDRRYGIL
jgi:hypothetical protein